MTEKYPKLYKFKKKLFDIIEVGGEVSWMSRCYDVFSAVAILVNIAVVFMSTYAELRLSYGKIFTLIEAVTVVFFSIDYVLRIWTANILYPNKSRLRAILKYALSFTGIIDLLSFLPYYLPFFFPAGAVAFRMFRVVRLFKLFRINAYHDSLSVIAEVLSSKRQQLLSSVFIIVTLTLASSLCMYSVENAAQPEVFTDAFSGIWWAVMTILTVGYGEIYPITTLGKLLALLITFLGVGMVAIPTAIISAGFVDQYSRIKRLSEFAREEEDHFIKVHLTQGDKWINVAIKDLGLPHGIIVAAIKRGMDVIVPRGDVVLKLGDTLILGAESLSDDKHIDLKEIVLKHQHPWNGVRIKELDISRQTFIVMVKRGDRVIIPKGDLILREGDKIILFSQTNIANAETISI